MLQIGMPLRQRGSLKLRRGGWGLLRWHSNKEPACQVRRRLETQVGSLGWEDPLEKEMATHSSILAWRIAMDRGAWWASVHGVAELDMTELLSIAHSTWVCILKAGIPVFI